MNPLKLAAGILVIGMGVSADSAELHTFLGEFLTSSTVGNGVSIAFLIIGSTLIQSGMVDKTTKPQPPTAL